MSRTVVIIPARNEQESIAKVLKDLPAVGMVLVVGNGSTDNTAKLTADAGATVIREEIPGYGQACWTGIEKLQGDAPKFHCGLFH